MNGTNQKIKDFTKKTKINMKDLIVIGAYCPDKEREDMLNQAQQVIGQMQEQIDQLQGDLQTASREAVSANKKVAVEKFKTSIDKIKNKGYIMAKDRNSRDYNNDGEVSIQEELQYAQETVEGAPSFLDKYRQAVANTKVRQMDDVPQALGKVTVKEPPASALGKVTTIGSKVEDVVEPIIPNDRRMKLLEMIKQDKKLLGK
jgi:hypothetical protein